MRISLYRKKNESQLNAVVSAWCWESGELNQLTKEVIRVFFEEGKASCKPSSFLLRRKFKISGPERSH